MSEYQYVGFRGIDRPVSDRNLEFMRRQSTRAEITPWSFQNEYSYGSFRGDAMEMLRRGYDIYLHYSNYGTRTLVIRFPHGLPDPASVKPYLVEDSLRFQQDKRGPGASLTIDPYYEAGDLDELWDIEPLLERLLPLRAEILEGDLRPLYLAHLAIVSGPDYDADEVTDAPVPAGLGEVSDAQRALAEFNGLSVTWS